MVCSMGHTFSPTCMLHHASNEFTRRASVASTDPPPISVQYFYCSILPIHDPLLPIPSVSSNPATSTTKVPPRPFSVHDNIALEDGWLKYQKRVRSKNNAPGAKLSGPNASPMTHEHILRVVKESQEKQIREAKQTNSRGFEALEPMPENKSDMISKAIRHDPHPAGLGKEHRPSSPDVTLLHGTDYLPLNLGKEHRPSDNDSQEKQMREAGQTNSQGFDALESMPENKSDMISKAIGNPPHTVRRSSPDLTLCDEPRYIPFDDTMPVTSEEIGNDEFESGIVKKKRSWSPFRHREKAEKPNERDDIVQSAPPSQVTQNAGDVNLSSSLPGRDTSGTPFLRIPSRLRRSRSRSPESLPSAPALGQADGPQSPQDYQPKTSSPLRPTVLHESSSSLSGEDEVAGPTLGTSSRRRSLRPKSPMVKVPKETTVAVGMLRLHVVRMPSMKMWPIYWDPIHDISSVIRGTWFFRDSMMPIESDLANRIEEGYEYIRPWTVEYVEELNSCMEVGPEAELKLIYKLGQDLPAADQSRPTTGKSGRSLLGIAAGELGSEETRLQQAVVAAKLAENKSAGVLDGFTSSHKDLADASVIYANGRDAQILRPSQLPSVSRGRKPLANIRKGKAVGIPIIRGFDMKAWEKLHPPSNEAAAVIHARKMAHEIKKASTIDTIPQLPCIACESADERPKPTDLVLVIHGIGQKLSERVESYHFTHNINRFRRDMNEQLQHASVRAWLRQDFGSVMVLPVNWRSKVDLDAGSPDPNANRSETGSVKNLFTLKDITAESLPGVRNLISDVMLDIPYYLSHHKPKMIVAVIEEANRIYRLWCNNNPGFQENGRVHLIAHSLGSVMCLDILSNQPTKLPNSLDLKSDKLRGDIFEFDTKSLFFCGSPAGIFLLLNKAPLIPRKGREKLDTEGEDANGSVAGEAGTYGCLAVDNLYNVMHYLDPVAYRLNACVDVDYAAALKPAFVPNATGPWTQYFGTVFRGTPAVPSTKNATSLDTMPRRPTVINMPSTVELETHDFTREEIAEKRMFLLNDNGQIDYTLHSSGFSLGIEYLNMLSAHSSYWSTKDFVRFLAVEIGRKPGKTETLNAMKAAKKAFGTK